MKQMEREGEHPTGLAAIRVMLLTGFRRMEVLAMRKEWIEPDDNCVAFPDTKSGAQMRAAGDAAMIELMSRGQLSTSPYVFPADWGDGHFIGVVRVLDRVCAHAGLENVTPHVLRHTFASTAVASGQGLPMIGKLLGHTQVQTTARYAHLAAEPVRIAADAVAQNLRQSLG